MRLIVAPDAVGAAERAADVIAEGLRLGIANRQRAVLAMSRLEADSPALQALARMDLDWSRIHLVQVDERVVPAEDPRRNAWHLHQALVARGPLPSANWHPMPVEDDDREHAALAYAAVLRDVAGAPPRLDVVHLGLGTDGHTASLLPNNPVLEVRDRDVSFACAADGQLRMTLTYCALDRAKAIVWLVMGRAKASVLAQLLSGEGDLPALRVAREQAMAIADPAAASTESVAGIAESTPGRRT